MHLHRWLIAASLTFSIFTGSQHAQADNWPQWRARLDGVSSETGLPAEWDKASGKNIAWRLRCLVRPERRRSFGATAFFSPRSMAPIWC